MLSIQPMGHWLLAVPAWQQKKKQTLCEKQTERRLKTAVWEYDTQTTAIGWIKEASVTLVA